MWIIINFRSIPNNRVILEVVGLCFISNWWTFCDQCFLALNQSLPFLYAHSTYRYSNLILNLFSLMVDANIPDIALEPDKTVKKVRGLTSAVKQIKMFC